jgi:nucleoside-diphosphate kinase
MAIERTFAMIKPNAVSNKHVGEIVDAIEKAGFNIVEMKRMQLSLDLAKEFYEIHSERPFFGGLTNYIASGPVVAMVLEKENAILAWRDLMGATDPKDAEDGTIRKRFGVDIDDNATHGSDAPETAKIESELIFKC